MSARIHRRAAEVTMRRRLYIWWLDNRRQVEIILFVLALVGGPLLGLLFTWLGFGGSGDSGVRDCGSGRFTWDC